MKAQEIKFKNNDLNWLNEVTEYKLPVKILEDLLHYDEDHKITIQESQMGSGTTHFPCTQYLFSLALKKNTFSFNYNIIWHP